MGEHIRTRRLALGMSQGDLAQAVNVTQGAVSQWESGLTKPTLDTLVRIAKVLDCTTDDLLVEQEGD